MDEETVAEATIAISDVIEDMVRDKSRKQAFTLISNVCLRLSTYPLSYLDMEERQAFLPQYRELVSKALDEFNGHLNKLEVN